jgi:hypothetical protein
VLRKSALSIKWSIAKHEIEGTASGVMHVLRIDIIPAGVVLERYRVDREDV